MKPMVCIRAIKEPQQIELNEIVLYDEIHDPIPYIKKKLKLWSANPLYLSKVSYIKTVEDAQKLIQEENIWIIQIDFIEYQNVNPYVEWEVA